MSQILLFPAPNAQQGHNYDADIDEVLASVPARSREKLRFELIKTIDSYGGFFSQWPLNMADIQDEALREQLYGIARQEHGRKVRMLKDIMRLKAQVLVSEYRKGR